MKTKRNGLSESEAGKIGGYITAQKLKKEKEYRIEEYLQNPGRCLQCGKILTYKHRHNKFCSRSCSGTYNNLKRGSHSEEYKQKISQGVKKYYVENNLIKTKYCKYCGSEKGKCLNPDICKKYRIFKSLEKFGFDKRKIGCKELYDEYNRIKKLLMEEYKNHIDDKLLNEKYNYTSGLANFHKLLKSMGIETKSAKERISEAYLLGKLNVKSGPQYKSKWHTTWDNNKVYLRSSYEIDYANELDKNFIKYKVEYLRIKYFDTIYNRYRCSIPDFYLPDTNTIVEIKSKYTLNVQNMKDKFLAYKNLGYNIKLILEHKEVDIEKI